MALGLASALLASTAVSNAAQAEDLTLCWAAWDPANALVELSKDFTKETGIGMKFEFVPWTNYADRFLNELNSKGKLCDLIIGDSQWIGGSAENGHYVKLNDFFDKEGIKMDDFVPATVVGYSEWPKNTPNYWALPAMGDVVGWTYRKDWFAKPELQKEFKEKYGWDLAAPTTFDQLKQIAEFFQKREIDGKTVYGASIYTERGSEGVTMGVMDVLYRFGFKYENPDKPYEMEGFVNSEKSVKGLEFYKALYDCCTPPGASNSYMGEGVDAFKSGQVAMHMNFAFTWPGLQKDEKVGGDKIGFFANPEGPDGEQFAQLGGQGISVVSYSDKQDAALQIHQVVRQQGRAGQVVVARRLLLPEGGASRTRASPTSQPYAQTFLDSMAIVKDFWAEPSYASLLQAIAEALPRLCRRRQGHRQGSARRPGQGLDRSLPGRRQDLSRLSSQVRPAPC